MIQQLENLAYEARPTQIQRQVVYQVGDLESLSASALYYGTGGSPLGSLSSYGIVRTPLIKATPIGSGNSGFLPALNLGLGQGIARIDSNGIVERARKDDDLPSHLNYEYLIPGKKTASGKQKWINLVNIHIDLEDDK